MSEDEKRRFEKDVDNTGWIIGLIIFIILAIVIFIKAYTSVE